MLNWWFTLRSMKPRHTSFKLIGEWIWIHRDTTEIQWLVCFIKLPFCICMLNPWTRSFIRIWILIHFGLILYQPLIFSSLIIHRVATSFIQDKISFCFFWVSFLIKVQLYYWMALCYWLPPIHKNSSLYFKVATSL